MRDARPGRYVLTHPLVVEAIGDDFLPVLVYNNRPDGHDAAILKRFNEPAWNFHVVIVLDSKARDIIPRKDRVWILGDIASRMVEALETARRSGSRRSGGFGGPSHRQPH